MTLENLLLMRHEILLIITALILIISEIVLSGDDRKNLRSVAVILMLMNTITGFLPIGYSSLFGGMYKTTVLNILVKNILNIGVLIVFIQSYKWLGSDNQKSRITEYFVLILSTVIGMDFMISAGDFLMFYLGLELATIPVAALSAYELHKNKSAEAGIKLILLAAFSSGILLYGLSMIYGMTGSIYFDDITSVVSNNSLTALAFIFFFSGMAFKISIVPFHLWTADVYEGSPINITSFLSVVSKGAAAFVLTTVLFTVFKSIPEIWQDIIYITAVLTMTTGNLFAIRQTNLKRFLAFSSISQAGFILLGIIGGSEMGMTSVVYYILVYIFSNLGAFGVVSVISDYSGKENIEDYNGLYQTNPLLSLVMMISLFSLAGIPPVAGFFGKFFLFMAGAEKGFYILVLIAVINAIISLYYYLLVVKAMFINKNENPIPSIKADWFSRIGLIICVAGIFLIGFASAIFEFIRKFSFGIN